MSIPWKSLFQHPAKPHAAGRSLSDQVAPGLAKADGGSTGSSRRLVARISACRV